MKTIFALILGLALVGCQNTPTGKTAPTGGSSVGAPSEEAAETSAEETAEGGEASAEKGGGGGAPAR